MAGECPFCQKLRNLQELPDGDIVWEMPNSVTLLGPWQYFTGYCIVVARRHVSELSEMPTSHRRGFFDEMCLVAQAIEGAFRPRKLNYELLGNQVPHLHWHLFPRRTDDPDVLRPVWFALDKTEHDQAEKTRLLAGTASRLDISNRLKMQLERLTVKGRS